MPPCSIHSGDSGRYLSTDLVPLNQQQVGVRLSLRLGPKRLNQCGCQPPIDRQPGLIHCGLEDLAAPKNSIRWPTLPLSNRFVPAILPSRGESGRLQPRALMFLAVRLHTLELVVLVLRSRESEEMDLLALRQEVAPGSR